MFFHQFCVKQTPCRHQKRFSTMRNNNSPNYETCWFLSLEIRSNNFRMFFFVLFCFVKPCFFFSIVEQSLHRLKSLFVVNCVSSNIFPSVVFAQKHLRIAIACTILDVKPIFLGDLSEISNYFNMFTIIHHRFRFLSASITLLVRAKWFLLGIGFGEVFCFA